MAGLVLLSGGAGHLPGFADLEPGPVCFVVLWGALRGGLWPGLFAALLAGVVHGFGVLVGAGYRWQVLLEPGVGWSMFAFTAIAFVVGWVRDGARLEVLRLRRARGRRLGSIDHGAQLQSPDGLLDPESLITTVARSEVDDTEHMFEAPLDMLVAFCGASKCSALLVLPGGLLDLAAHRGWSEDEIRPRLQAATSDERILRAIAGSQPVVDLDEPHDAATGPLMVVPIADGTGVVKVLLCIDEMQRSERDDMATRTFLGVAAWLAANVRRIQIDAPTGDPSRRLLQVLKHKFIGSSSDLAERIHLEDARRQRYGVASEFVAVRLLDPHAGGDLAAVETALVDVLGPAVSITDDLYQFGFPGCYVLVATGAKPDNGEAVIASLEAGFASGGERTIGPVECRHFVATSEAPTLAAQLPLLTAYFCGESPVPLDQRCPVPEPRPQRHGNAEEFVRRLRLEIELSKRFAADVHLIDFRRDGSDTGLGPMIGRHLWNSMGRLLRVTDGIYVLGPNRCVVLLPFTSCLDASQIWSRLEGALRRTIPADCYRDVQCEFLALADTDVKQTMQYLVDGLLESEEEQGRKLAPIVSDSELQELSFSEAEFADLHAVDTELQNAFRVVASTGTGLPALPTREDVTRRWEELFERDANPPASSPATATATLAARPVAAATAVAAPGEQSDTARRLLSQVEALQAMCSRLRAQQSGAKVGR